MLWLQKGFYHNAILIWNTRPLFTSSSETLIRTTANYTAFVFELVHVLGVMIPVLCGCQRVLEKESCLMWSFSSRTPIPQNVYKRLALYFNTLGVMNRPSEVLWHKHTSERGDVHLDQQYLQLHRRNLFWQHVCTQRTARQDTFTFSSVPSIATVIICIVLRRVRVTFSLWQSWHNYCMQSVNIVLCEN